MGLRETSEERPVKIFSVTSGKGGVGKTNVVINLAIALTEFGQKVLIVDADLGLGNLDVLLGIRPKYHLGDVITEHKSLDEVIVAGPRGIKILPAASGVESLTNLALKEKMHFFSELCHLDEGVDTILIDTAAGISPNVLFFSSLAHKVIVVATKEPTSITDAYATMKVLHQGYGEKDFHLIVNLVEDEKEGLEVYRALRKVTERFLRITPAYIGSILKDMNLQRAVCQQKALMEIHPDSSACRDFRQVARKILTDCAGEEGLLRAKEIDMKDRPVNGLLH